MSDSDYRSKSFKARVKRRRMATLLGDIGTVLWYVLIVFAGFWFLNWSAAIMQSAAWLWLKRWG